MSLNKEKVSRRIRIEILAWDRHKNVTESNIVINVKPSVSLLL